MLLFKWLCVVFLQISCCYSNSVEVTFRNVAFQGYRMFTPKFRPTILFGNSLKDYLPNNNFDTIEFIDQNVPVLYENSITDISELNKLIIEYNNVVEIRPGAFKNLPHLNGIYLKGNKIERIENGVFNNLTTNYLDLSHNQITTIYSQAFDNMEHLFYIHLGYNKIKKWDANWFKSTPELSIIFMKNNLIDELPQHSFKNLKTKVRNLNLIFSNNNISKIHPDAFKDLKKINQLYLSNNSLQTFSKILLANITVNDLRLNNNTIQCFDKDSFDTIFRGQSVYIEFNPIDCKCLKNIQKWAKAKDKNLGVNDIICGEDENEFDVIEIQEISPFPSNITLVLPKSF